MGGGGSNPAEDAVKKIEKNLVGTWYPTEDNKTATECFNDDNNGDSEKLVLNFKDNSNLVVTFKKYSELNCGEDTKTKDFDYTFNYAIGKDLDNSFNELKLTMTGYTSHKGSTICDSTSRKIECKYLRGEKDYHAGIKLNGNLMPMTELTDANKTIDISEVKTVLIKK